MEIILIYQADEWKCGPGSGIANLYNGLKKMGYTPIIVKMGKEYDDIAIANGMVCHVLPHNVMLDMCRELPSIIWATHMYRYKEWTYDLINVGCALCFHSKHTNRYSKDFINLLYHNNTEIIAVRPTIRDYVISKGIKPGNVVYIPHMYISKKSKEVPKTNNAVCITRIAPWKNVDIIMKANTILIDNGNSDKCVVLRGVYYKGYMKNNVIGKIPGWNDDINFTGPMYPSCNQGFENGRGYEICSIAKFSVDLTNFPSDNQDLQQCALESIDAGCVYIGHTKYIDGEILRLNYNCLSANDPYELAEILMTSYENYQDLVENAKELLEKHKPENVVHYYDDLYDRLSL